MSLLRTIRDEPEDDIPRLIYADWLEECGDFRADLIRAQCECESLASDDPRKNALLNQCEELIKQFGSMCAEPLANGFDSRKSSVTIECREFATIEFSRGFISNLRMEASDFIACAELLFGRVPLVFELQLWNVNPVATELAKLEELTYVDSLRIAGDLLTSDTLCQLVSSGHLQDFASLDLNANLLGKQGIVQLAKGKWNRLDSLDYSANHLDHEGLNSLAEFARENQLHHVALRNTGMETNGFIGTPAQSTFDLETRHFSRFSERKQRILTHRKHRSRRLAKEYFPNVSRLEIGGLVLHHNEMGEVDD
jgi:uncharacterized protein (TIGR02996 family)